MAVSKEEREIIQRMFNAYSKRKILAKMRKWREQILDDKKSGKMNTSNDACQDRTIPSKTSEETESTPEELARIDREALEHAHHFADLVLRTQRISRLN